MMTEQADDEISLTPAKMRLTALIVASALFMQNIDSTVIATALPAMAKTFHADPLHMSVALTSYLLSLAVFIPASGWFADKFGARTVFRAAIALFTIGSVLCGFSTSLGALVASRILQGIGGAMMVPVGRLLLLRSVRKTDMIAATSWLTMPALIGPIVGPPLGGLIVTYASWPWIFDINVPIGVIGILAVTWFIEDVRDPIAAGRLDLGGLAYSGFAMAALMIAIETVGRSLLPLWATIAAFAGGLLACLLYARHAKRVDHPVLDFTLMRIPTFANSVIAGSFFRVAVGATPFLLPLMLQLDFGKSAAASGSITFTAAIGALALKPLALPLLRRFGFRSTMIWTAIGASLFTVACAAFRPFWPIIWLDAVLLIGGIFRSLQFTAYNTIAYADIPRARMSAATSLYSTMQQITLTLGVAIGAAALEFSTSLSRHIQPSLNDFSVAFVVVGLIGAVAIPVCWRLHEDAGEELSGHHPIPPHH
ncbi:MAG: MFS transporter [Rhodospirillales bacterium 20-60-12]|nr:MAG: MFS transporter [Rhodospirillales bacterium 20-60-12]HQT67761.1 MFS transporter [Acetobacteraceae bacterium]